MNVTFRPVVYFFFCGTVDTMPETSATTANTDPTPGDVLSPAETRRALLVAAVAWGVFGSAWMSLVTGAPFVSYARKLGASTLEFGLLSSLPYLGVLAQVPGSYIAERLRRRKPIFLICGTIHRSLWFLVAAIPWLIPYQFAELRVGALLALLLLSSALGNAGSPAWLSWFADFIPVHIRGRYVGNRAALATLTGVIVAGVAGLVLDRTQSYPAFTVMFCIAASLGVVDIVMFLAVRETAMVEHEGPPWQLRSVIVEPLRTPVFRRYLAYAFSEAFMFQIAGPFFWLMALEDLKIGSFWSNFYIMMVPMICTAVTLPLWGKACDRFGSRPLVSVGTFMTLAFPVAWLFATRGQFHTALAIAAVVGGSFGSAIQVADMNMLMGLTPRVNRSVYLAAIAVAAALGWVIAPVISGAAAQSLKNTHVLFAGRVFGRFHFLLAAAIVIRLLHVFLIVPRLPEVPRSTTGTLIRYLLTWPLQRLSAGFRV